MLNGVFLLWPARRLLLRRARREAGQDGRQRCSRRTSVSSAGAVAALAAHDDGRCRSGARGAWRRVAQQRQRRRSTSGAEQEHGEEARGEAAHGAVSARRRTKQKHREAAHGEEAVVHGTAGADGDDGFGSQAAAALGRSRVRWATVRLDEIRRKLFVCTNLKEGDKAWSRARPSW